MDLGLYQFTEEVQGAHRWDLNYSIKKPVGLDDGEEANSSADRSLSNQL